MSNILEARESFRVIFENFLRGIEAYLVTHQGFKVTHASLGFFQIRQGELSATINFERNYADAKLNEDDGCEYSKIFTTVSLTLDVFRVMEAANVQYFLFNLAQVMKRFNESPMPEVTYLVRDAAKIAEDDKADRLARCKWSMFRFVADGFSKLDLRYGRTGVLPIPPGVLKDSVQHVLSVDPDYTQDIEDATAKWYHDRVEIKRNKAKRK